MRKRPATPLERIELVVFDVDGVLTDGKLHFGARGESHKSFHVRDGHGIKLLMSAGVAVAIVSGRRFAGVAIRARQLGVSMLVQGAADKVAACETLARRLGTDLAHCACLVDDTVDLPLMTAVGFAAAVADAHPLVLRAAHWVSTHPGGTGAARDLCDAVLAARARRR
jgi:3-deoxy-D-manno-octulosonate 8-phosphate phosphatase (KDO 8-P phosphatase)